MVGLARWPTLNNTIFISRELYQQIFSFSSPGKISLVTSDPYGVCLCSKTTDKTLFNCSKSSITKKRYAGQSLILHIASVGQMNGQVRAKISVKFEDYPEFRVKHQKIYNISSIPFCQKVKVAVYPKTPNVTKATFEIGIDQTNAAHVSESSNSFKLSQLSVEVDIPSCPFPFELDMTKGCDCPKYLKRHLQTKCDINNETLTRPHDDNNIEWVGYIRNKTAFAGSQNCQRGRCKPGGSSLSIHNLSDICEDGREGRICGKCKLFSFSRATETAFQLKVTVQF